MSYLVNKTNGQLLATVLDGQTNSSTSSITFIGKQVTNYGEIQNENFLHILENFSNSISPVNPIEGQLWWNNTAKTMQVFDGTSWRPATGFTSANTTPLASYVGDQWWDTTNQQFKIYNGTSWVVVGPAFSALDSVSGAVVEAVYDTGLTKHTVVKLYNTGTLTAIMSKDAAFTPNVAIAGFTSINPGITFSTAVDAVKLYGTATNADKLGNLTPSQYLRSDADTVATGNVSLRAQTNFGPLNELNVHADPSSNVAITSTGLNREVAVRVNVNSVLTDALVVSGFDGLVRVAGNPTAALGIAPKQYVDSVTTTLRNDTTTAISSNVSAITANLSATNANVAAANVAIQTLSTNKADLASPVFSGAPTAPTAAPGTANTQVATTAFVAAATSVFDATRIYNGSTDIKINSANVILTVSGTTVATAQATGITTITQPQNDNSANVATTAYSDRGDKNFVKNSVKYQPTCYVSNLPPNNAIGADGDVWFQYL